MTRTAIRTALHTIQDLDEQLFDQIARAESPVADAVLPKLTRAADHSVLWMAAAVAIGAAGGRHGRRAAERGLISLGIASLLANQVGKRLVPRRRPTSRRVPDVRRARRTPRSTSFPSGHSASAAAFAVGASTVVPELAVPLGVTAVAVCFSRVYTGVHFPSDVVAGAGLGAGCAVLVALLPGNLRPPRRQSLEVSPGLRRRRARTRLR